MRRFISEDLYNRIIEAFRIDPRPNVVARNVGIDFRTAQKAWERGFHAMTDPRYGQRPELEPISVLFEREKAKARAEIVAQQAAKRAITQKERDDASAAAVKARAQEGQIVDLARGAALHELTIAAQLAVAARSLAPFVKTKIEEEAKRLPTDPMQMSAVQGLNMLRMLANTIGEITANAHEAMVLERLHLGQPGAIIQVQNMSEMTLDEAQGRIESAVRAIEDARQYGGLRVVDGGLEEPEIGKKVSA